MSRSEVAGKANKNWGETPVWNNLGKKIHLIHFLFFFFFFPVHCFHFDIWFHPLICQKWGPVPLVWATLLPIILFNIWHLQKQNQLIKYLHKNTSYVMVFADIYFLCFYFVAALVLNSDQFGQWPEMAPNWGSESSSYRNITPAV
jgi:hypothetical protein